MYLFYLIVYLRLLFLHKVKVTSSLQASTLKYLPVPSIVQGRSRSEAVSLPTAAAMAARRELRLMVAAPAS